MTKRRVAIAIGVGDAAPLPYLRGAINGARAFHHWASQLGYVSKLVIDEDDEVTLARLRFEFESLLGSQGQLIHRLVIYFAGHGLIREAEEGLWLLSDWNNELRAVAVEGLKRRLYMYDIQQIAIFSDSCRSLPQDIQAADLAADPVLGRGPSRSRKKQPAIDKFMAAQDGSDTFMLPGATPDDDRCLFSGVLIEALWGTKPAAFSTILTDKITSRSLGKYLESEVPRVAKRYKRELVPTVSPSFPEGDDIYFPEGVTPKPPLFSDWPPPSLLPPVQLGSQNAASTLSGSRAGDVTRIVFRRRSKPLIAKIRGQKRPYAFETGAGFAVEGGTIRRVWTRTDVFAESHGRPNWWRVRQKSRSTLTYSAPVVIEFEDGMFAATTALPGFIASVIRDGRGISALLYRGVHMHPQVAAVSEATLAQMDSGALRADAVTDLAIELRKSKHVDPVLGVISAYLYDSIGDLESIRRMAYYYTQHGQPIPYDVALLARLQGGWRHGRLWVKVPAVGGRMPRTGAERLNKWTHSRTRQTTGEVGGLWPWMRQGWTFLDDPVDDGSTLTSHGLIQVIDHLAKARFTTLDAFGGEKIVRLFNLSA